MKDVFGNEMFNIFNFDNIYEGIVVENKDLLEKGYISLIIPELLVNENINNDIVEQNIYKGNIENKNDLNLSNKIIKGKSIKCYPIVSNQSMKKGLEFFLEQNKPDLNDRVLVIFLNGNPKNAYYINYCLFRPSDII